LQCGYNARKAGALTLIIAVVVLSTVLAVSMLPGAGLQPTALRASRAAEGMFLVFSLLVAITYGCYQITAFKPVVSHFAGESCRLPRQPLFDLTCVRLC
jgi:hypothetical protein